MEIVKNPTYMDIPIRYYMRYALCECGGKLIVEGGPDNCWMTDGGYLHDCDACGAKVKLDQQSPRSCQMVGE